MLEDAVRRGRQGGRLLIEVASAVWERSDLTGEEAVALASAETDAARAEQCLSDRAQNAGGQTRRRAVRVLADPNVLVSAVLALGGGPGALLAAVDAGEIVLIVTAGLLASR